MSEHIHHLEIGQTLSCKGPIPTYPWSPNKHNQIVLVAGGTGITPMYQLIRKIFSDPTDRTKVVLVFGNISQEDILLKDELDAIQKDHTERFVIEYVLEKPPAGWKSGTGYITKEILGAVIPRPNSENIKIFVCGPLGLYQSVSGTKSGPMAQGELVGVLADMGYSNQQVHKF